MLKRVGLEVEEVNGKMTKEIEIGFWVRVADWDEVKDVIGDAEKQEQISIYVEKQDDNYVAGQVRIRRVEARDGSISNILCIKQKFGNGDANGALNTEVEMEVSDDAYLALAGMCTGVVRKHRYTVPITGSDLEWTLDCAPDGKGGYKPWVRVELEVPNLEAPLPNLPFSTEDEIIPAGFGGGYEKEKFDEMNDKLFNEMFFHKGPLVKQKEVDSEEEE